MAKLLALVLMAVMMLSLGAVARSQRASDTEAICFASGGHADSRSCLADRAAKSAVRLKSVEMEFKASLFKSANEPAESAQAVAAFDKASRQYQQYPKYQCESVAALAFGGNGAGDRRLLCQIDLDTRRIADLANERHRGDLTIGSSDRGPCLR